MMKIRERDVVRALIVAPDFSLLLIRILLPDRTVWITPGGGVEGDENEGDALQRELAEETGRNGWNTGPVVWTRSNTFDYDGETRTQHERFFWIESEWFPAPDEMPDEHERKIFGGFKWWSLSELEVSTELFAPRGIAKYYRLLIEQGLPAYPVDVGR